MFSPVKLASINENSKEITSNFELRQKLLDFFNQPGTDPLWDINTTRQTVTKALRNTKYIPLRINVAPVKDVPKNTLEWNQVTTLADGPMLHTIPMFMETYNWCRTALLEHCSTVEFGRIFFSKLDAGTGIDEHVDDGKYFDYYDRFHFTIQNDDNNIFYIREEPVRLKTAHLYWVNNHVLHYLENNSTIDRINLIVDAHLS